MYYLKTEQSFDSAHFLKGYDGKCSNLHGHRWRVVVEIKQDFLIPDGQEKGMITDFGKIKSTLKSICDSLDHSLIYEKDSLKKTTVNALKDEGFELIEVDFRPTAENFSKFFFEKLSQYHYPVSRVEVYETPNNCAAYEA